MTVRRRGHAHQIRTNWALQWRSWRSDVTETAHTIGTAFGTTSDSWSPRNTLFLLDSFESATSSPGHQQTPDNLKNTKKNWAFGVLWDHFRDRFRDHFVIFRQ